MILLDTEAVQSPGKADPFGSSAGKFWVNFSECDFSRYIKHTLILTYVSANGPDFQNNLVEVKTEGMLKVRY